MSAAPLCSSQPNLHGLCKHPYPTKLPICPQLSTSCVVASRFLNHLSERNWAHPATLSNVLEPGHNGMVVARSFVTNTTCFRPRFPSLSTLPALSSQTLQTPTDNLTSNASLKGHNFPHHLSDDIPFTHAAQRRPEDRQRRTAYVGDVQGRLRVGRGYTGGYGSNWRFWFGTSMILDFETCLYRYRDRTSYESTPKLCVEFSEDRSAILRDLSRIHPFTSTVTPSHVVQRLLLK
ncbi:hypothetical protein WG66_004468 [Moniliophthora roreri]|uniref:Uncharacterized protein n=1 Tax=Moniliophthora roreri TaxID=221103 RepID=A0A0W0F740_MONRR|nr:hypothetical protein WG66_004468 [Moniliophthora roreri]